MTRLILSITSGAGVLSTPGLFDTYNEIMESSTLKADPKLRGSLYTSADINPDDEAGLHKLAKKTGLPVESLRADGGKEARRKAAADMSEALPPATASFLADPENAAVAHDDAEQLADIENVTRNGFGGRGPVSTLTFAGKGDRAAAQKAREYVGAVLGGIKSSVPTFNEGLSETGRVAMEATGWGAALRSLSDLTGNETFRDIAEAPRLAELYWESLADEARVKVKARSVPDYLQQASGSLAVSLMSAPFGMAGEGAALGMFGISATGGQEELRAAGYSEQQAAAVSIPKKIMEGLTEKIGLDALYKGGKPLVKAVTEFAFKDLLGEEVNTLYNAIADKVTVKPNMTWNDLGQDVVDTAIVTALQGGMQGAAFHGSAKVADYLHADFQESRRTRATVDFMEALGDATKNSKTFQRMPEKLRDLVSKVTAEGPVENVYVPAEKVRELFQGKAAEPDALVASMLDDPESYYQALAVGGDVVIPLPEYVEKWAGTEYHQALVNEIRLHPGDMSKRELDEWNKRKPETLDVMLKDLDEQGAAVTSDRQVYDAVLGELLGVGRERSTAEREALLWQSRYRTRAERLGRDAWELYQQNPLKVRRPLPEFMTRRDFVDTSIDPFLDRLRTGDVPTERDAFGDSLVDFLRMKGVQDDAGELGSLGVDEGLRPFERKMIQEGGLPMDKAREAAVEAGYLPDGSDIRALLDAIDAERRGAPVYSTTPQNESAANLRLDMEQLRQYLESTGVDVDTMTNEEIRKALKGMELGQGAPLPGTIEIDGVQRSTVNSNGEPIARTEEGVRNFWTWFGDSKAVDAEGRPVVVYHGTDTKFSKVDMKKGAQGLFWFTSDRDSIASGDAGAQGTSIIMELYVKVEAPADWKQYDQLMIDEFKGRGLDGAILPSGDNAFDGFVLSPGQVKAVGNRGGFDPANANIYGQGPAGPRLIVNHNLSSENLIYADELGGLAAPSLAVTPEGIGHESYGDITLIGTEALGNPEKEPVLDSDAYSATFPRPEYPKVTSKVAQKVVDEFRPYARPFGESYLVDAIWDNAVNHPNPAKILEEISRYSGVKAKFLHDVLGVEIEPTSKPVAREVEWSGSPSWREFVKSADWSVEDLASDDPARVKLYADATVAARKAIDEYIDGLPGKDGKGLPTEFKEKLKRPYLGKRYFHENGELAYNIIDRARRDIHQNEGKTEVDKVATAEAIDKELAGHEAEFKAWLEGKILGMFKEPFLKVNGKKVPYTLENIVAHMTSQKLRASEKNMTFGSGAARAAASHQFVDLEKMRQAAAENILPKAELEEFRAKAEKLLESYRTQVAEHYKGTDYRGNIDYWNAFDDSMKAIARWAKGAKTEANLQAALSREGFKKVPKEILSLGVEAGNAMLKAPVPYFEAKPQRAVKLSEFAGAVVPDDVSPEVLEILKKNGIAVKKYGERFDEEARHQAAAELRKELQAKGERVFFQYPTISPEDARAAKAQVLEEMAGVKPDSQRAMELEIMLGQYNDIIAGNASYADFQPGALFQPRAFAEGKRGSITFRPGLRDIVLLEKADLSTFIHESGHAWLEELREDAQAEGAPEQVRKDWETVAAWAGIAPDVSTIDVEAHEKFARAVEAYLMEGRAPSAELQPAFQRFKAWLLRIYRSVRNLNVQLNNDVRGVLDRLLATDEEIQRAEELQGFHPLFTDAAAAGMTEREFEAYRQTAEKAHNEAEAKLQQKLMAELTREQKAWWKEEREKVRGEVEAEAKDQPVYQAFQVLTTGKDFEGNAAPEGTKFSKADLVRMYGKEFIRKLPRAFSYTYAKEGGLHPDAVAEVFGFSSGDELLRQMVNAPPMKKFIEAETDVRMRQVYGDMLNDGTIADEALQAIHSDYQGQVLQAELRALKRKQREVSPFVKAEKKKGDEALQREKEEREYERRWMEAEKKLAIQIERGAAEEEIRKIKAEIRENKAAALKARREMEEGIPPLEAFRLWAVQAIGAKPVRSIIPSVYSRAEQKAGREAFEAAAKGQFDKAGEAKQKQLLNHYLYVEAVKAVEEADEIRAYAARLEKPAAQSRIGKAGGDYLDQINALLERYEFKKVSLETLTKRQSLLEWAKQQEELGLEASIPEEILLELERRNYKTLTIDELRAVRDALKNIEHLSREANRIRIMGEELEMEEAIARLTSSVVNNFDPQRIPIDKETRSWLDKQKETLSRFDASLIKAEQLIEWMDGGAIDGPWASMIFRPVAEAEAREHDLTLQYTVKLMDVLERYGKEKKEAMMEKVFISSLGESLTRQAIVAAALNTGNESNRTKLLDGYGWAEHQLDEMLGHLDGEDWALVQEVWDTIEGLWPEIAAMEKRLTGIAPEKIQAREIVNNHGTFRGGYFPVVYDARHSAAGEKQTDSKGDRLFDSTYVRATTEKGHTKARIEAAAYPILLSLEVIPQHMAQVIHDITHREAVVTANRLLNHNEIRHVLNSTISAPYYRMLKLWLATVANDRNVDRTGLEFWTRFMSGLRTNATIVGMGFRLTTMIAQVVGFSQSLDIVRPKYLGTAILRFTQHPFEAMDWVAAKSGEMRHRRNSLDRDIRDGVRKLMGKHGAKEWVQAKAFGGVALFDAIVSVPTWMGAYEQAKDEGLSEADAIESGDRAVRLSQGAGGAKDLAAVQRSNDMMKLFTMFYSYFSVLYNRLRNMGRLKSIGEIGFVDVAYKSFVMVMLPAVMGDLIVGRGPDDDEDGALWALRKILVYPFLTIPFLRDIMNSFESGRPYTLTPMSRLFEMVSKLPADVEKAAEGKKDLSDLVFQNFDIPGYAFGLPTGQARTTSKYLWDLMEGDLQADDMGDVLKGLAFGHKKQPGKN